MPPLQHPSPALKDDDPPSSLQNADSIEPAPAPAPVSELLEYSPETLPSNPEPLSSALYEQRVADLEKTVQDMAVQHQEEILIHVERVDALQAKLQYLAREASENAKQAASAARAGTPEKKLADKDLQIAQLMDEGQKLSSTEQQLRGIIKTLRSQIVAREKDTNEQRRWREKAETEITRLRAQSNEIEGQEKASQEIQRKAVQLGREVEKLKTDVAARDATIAEVKASLQEEVNRGRAMSAKANESLIEAGQKRIRELESSIAALEVEKTLAADRAKLQVTEVREKADRAAERARSSELEMKTELQIMESKLEAMRTRAEEASSGAVGDAHAKLLRQIETLQTQYAVASENWQGIETSLMARAANLEKERDEASRRESDIRRKAREAASRAKRQEEELEDTKSELPTMKKDLTTYQSQLTDAHRRADEAVAALAEANAEFDRQKKAWAHERAEKAETDRRPWAEETLASSLRNSSRPESPLLSGQQRTFSSDLLGLQAFPTKLRKASAPSSNGEPSAADRPASGSRPPAHLPMARSPMASSHPAPVGTPPSLSSGLDALASPPAAILHHEPFDSVDPLMSPKDNVQDMISVSTIGAGPSVQLVERMSAAIRRLESEKVAAREELARISGQRDEARQEIVSLMRTIEGSQGATKRVEELERDVAEINERYQTTLEMLGEKSELVEELRADVDDVKAMYRDLVERTIK